MIRRARVSESCLTRSGPAAPTIAPGHRSAFRAAFRSTYRDSTIYFSNGGCEAIGLNISDLARAIA